MRWRLRLLTFVVLCLTCDFCCTCDFALAAPERRVALVVGVSHYRNAPVLRNPVNDARLIAPVLARLQFQVQTVVDPDYGAMKNAIREFRRRLDGATVALFYYAGHGLQVGGRNYLLPVDATLAREPDLRYEAFDLQAVLDEMNGPARVSLVFLDACRDNPLSRSLAASMGTRSAAVGQGLAPVDTRANGTLIAYATAPGDVALDGDGANSPFTVALARYLSAPALDVRQMLTRVRADVQRVTSGRQRPWVNEDLDADFYMVPEIVPPPPVAGPASADVVFWQSISGSTQAADFDAYLTQFPDGSFVPLARSRMAALSGPPSPAPLVAASVPVPPALEIAAPAVPTQAPPPVQKTAMMGVPAVSTGKQTAPLEAGSFCPPAGTQVRGRHDDGTFFHNDYQGADPQDPTICLVGSIRSLFGIYYLNARETYIWGSEDRIRNGLLALFSGQSAEVTFDVTFTQAGSTHGRRDTWQKVGNDTVQVNGRNVGVVKYRYTMEGTMNSNYHAVREMWYDPALHLVLRRRNTPVLGGMSAVERRFDQDIVKISTP